MFYQTYSEDRGDKYVGVITLLWGFLAFTYVQIDMSGRYEEISMRVGNFEIKMGLGLWQSR